MLSMITDVDLEIVWSMSESEKATADLGEPIALFEPLLILILGISFGLVMEELRQLIILLVSLLCTVLDLLFPQ